MAQFIIGNRFRKKLQGWPSVQRLIWLLETVVIGIVLIIVRVMPVSMASRFGGRVGMWIGPRLKKNKAFKLNFKTAFPDLSPPAINQLVSQAWCSAGQVFAEYLHLREISDQRLEIEIIGDIEVFNNPLKPTVFVTAHYANWELAAGAIARKDIDIAVLYSPFANPYLDSIMRRARAALGVRLLARDESTRPMIQQMKKGSIGLVIDQRVDSGTPIPFFGMDKNTTLVPARLALSKACDLVPIRIERTALARYRVSFYPPIKPVDPEASVQDQSVQMMAQVNNYFEEWIRANPGDWFCSKRRWTKVRKPKAG